MKILAMATLFLLVFSCFVSARIIAQPVVKTTMTEAMKAQLAHRDAFQKQLDLQASRVKASVANYSVKKTMSKYEYQGIAGPKTVALLNLSTKVGGGKTTFKSSYQVRKDFAKSRVQK